MGVAVTSRRRTRGRVFAAAATALVLATLTACSSSAEAIDLGVRQVDGAIATDVQTQLQTATEAAMVATGSSGALVAVHAPWSGSWVAGLGTSTPGGAEVDTSMRFKVGTMTKPMTCDVLYGLAARGIVDLDDTIDEWLDTYPNAADITLEMLCDGTSGLAPYSDQLTGRFLVTPERIWNPRELVAYGLSKERSFEPGARFQESDTPYALLGVVLERAAGRSLEALYEEFVFEPLAMTSAGMPSRIDADGAWLHGHRSGDVEGQVDCAAPVDLTTFSPTAGYAAAGVVADITDLARYTQALALGARDYDDDARFAEPLAVSDSAPTWFTADGGAYQAGTLVGQYGSVPGYLTAAFADRETGMAVVVVLNNSRASADVVRALAWELAAIASKAPAAEGETAPAAGLPWTPDTYAAEVQAGAVCAG